MKAWLKKCLPNRESISRNKSMAWIAHWLHEHPYLTALNRKTVARGVAAGFLVAFIPIPAQIIFSSGLALLVRANLPVAIASTLVSNPFTFVPINLLIYQIGVFVTGSSGDNPLSIHELEFHWGNVTVIWEEFAVWFKSLGQTYLLGLLILSVSASLIGYAVVDLVWRFAIWRHLRARKSRNR